METLQWFYENKMSFNTLMSQQPQTLAFALLDSPVGLLAWNAQLLGRGSRRRLRPDQRDALLADRHRRLRRPPLLRERARDPAHRADDRSRSAVAAFGGDFSGIRRFAERDHKNIVHWSVFDHGGHFAAHKASDLLVGDVRKFFRRFR